MKFFVLTPLLVIAIACEVSAQVSRSKGRPDLPGTLLFEFGFNQPQGAPADFNTGFWGSRSVNVYYQYPVKLPILKSKFSIVPGFGLGLDRFKFINNNTLTYESGDLVMSKINLDITKSQFITNYVDVPIELRYSRNPGDPNRTFKAAIGFRAGLLLNAFTKIRYDDDGTTAKEKTKRDWELNTYRYSMYGKIGVGNFSVFTYYNMSTLFKTDQGPDSSSINNLAIGISLAGF
jgi:hypothetical protein